MKHPAGFSRCKNGEAARAEEPRRRGRGSPAQNDWKGANQTSRPGSWAMATAGEAPAKNWPHQSERGQ